MRVALLADAENFPASRLPEILTLVTAVGDPIIRRAYGDFAGTQLSEWSEAALSHGIVAVHVPRRSSTRNAADVALVIDAMDILHRHAVEAFALLSSDGDFVLLAHRLREAGCAVHGYGLQDSGPLSVACTEYRRVGPLSEKVGHPLLPPPATAIPYRFDVSESIRVLRRAYTISRKDSEGWVSFGDLGQSVRKVAPAFRANRFGHPTLTQLVAATGLFQVKGEAPGHSCRPIPAL